ncbi:MAG: RNA-binding protein [Promethearchaeota archaeon]|nr:MAG: RNA-binding protein [Candidatus Lokiarchaeota archaeon]
MENEEETIDNEFEDFEDEEVIREVVVPGEALTEDVSNFLPGRGTILNKERNKIVSLNIGLKQIKKNYVNVIPLRGFYTPRPGDKVIALVVDKNPVKYKCDINAKDFGQLKPKNTVKKGKVRGFRGGGPVHEDLSTERFDIGDILVVKVLSADRLNKPELTTVGKYLGKKIGGIVISIDTPKIPRVIGRNGSMIKMLKNLTKCNIFVTQNGRIWLKGEDIAHERLLIESINKIATEAHTVGLTDRMQEFIIDEKKKRGIV